MICAQIASMFLVTSKQFLLAFNVALIGSLQHDVFKLLMDNLSVLRRFHIFRMLFYLLMNYLFVYLQRQIEKRQIMISNQSFLENCLFACSIQRKYTQLFLVLNLPFCFLNFDCRFEEILSLHLFALLIYFYGSISKIKSTKS